MRRMPFPDIAEAAVRAVSFFLNISFLISVAAVFSFIPVLAGSGRGLALALIFFVPALIAVVVLIPFIYRKVFPAKTDENSSSPQPSGRYDSARKGLLTGIFADILLMTVCGFVSPDTVSSPYFLMLLAVPPPAGLLLGCIRPWGRHAGQAGPYINSACLTGVFFLLVIYAAFDLVPRDFRYETKFVEPGEYAMLSESLVRKMFPLGAEDVRISGSRRKLGLQVKWTCRTSEDAVRAFFANTDREWRENVPPAEMNEGADAQETDRIAAVLPENGILPESCLFYSLQYRNRGGWIMLYDRGSGILRGAYSTH